jgi:DNA-directed RNA polymerase subunit beta'
VQLIDFEPGLSVQEVSDEVTGVSSVTVLDPKQRVSAGKDLRPLVRLVTDDGEEIMLPNTDLTAQYVLPSITNRNLSRCSTTNMESTHS